MMPALDIDALLQPLPGDEPCGVSLIHDPEYEAIRTARRADDASVPAGIWQTTLKVADWPAVEAGCRRVLSNRSKDLTIAAWLGEAWLNRYGVAALPHCFQLMVGLCERYWDDLHPLPRDGDQGFRAAPFAWLAGAYADLLSAQIELFEGRDGLRGTLAQWQSAQRATLTAAARQDVPAAKRQEAGRVMTALQDAVRATSPAHLRLERDALEAARPLIEQLDALCTPKLGAEAPSFVPLMETMTHAALVLTECLTMHPNAPEPARSQAGDTTAAAEASVSGAKAVAPGVPQNRDDAYRQLEVIAEYLARYEPHSPVPYLIQRALEWGRTPLPVLLRELTSGDADGQRLWSFLGLLRNEGEKSK
ncbi:MULTISPECIES: type VI secretion system protein TssA [Paraburkholderia]|jgi:type VI secretion system protein ImpA|uniref:Type VI secretion system protein ImpA n=1 Tax=Paraburkholderia phenazinium TaxID=60549 RepID=A0A1N6KQX4_9BURK|nr:type VI secretion system protein TssA [Paraburkholderia phenazinium]SIO58925.1 type VI secretion system protein ImpA [Paraburkholderia phenazinium]